MNAFAVAPARFVPRAAPCARRSPKPLSARPLSSPTIRVSPVRVLPSETKDQLAERGLERRSPGPPVRVSPPAGDQLAVPAKQRIWLEREGRPRRLGSERLSDASSARSARVGIGLDACRRRIASSWRRTRISNSFERRGRPSSHTRANKFRTTRYTNDQSKQQPSLDHGKSAEPSEPDNSREPRTSLRTLRAVVAPEDLDRAVGERFVRRHHLPRLCNKSRAKRQSTHAFLKPRPAIGPRESLCQGM